MLSRLTAALLVAFFVLATAASADVTPPACKPGHTPMQIGKKWTCAKTKPPSAAAGAGDQRLAAIEALFAAPIQKLPGHHKKHAPAPSSMLKSVSGMNKLKLHKTLADMLAAIDKAPSNDGTTKLKRKLGGGAQLTATVTQQAGVSGVAFVLKRGGQTIRFGLKTGPGDGKEKPSKLHSLHRNRARAAGVFGTGVYVESCPSETGVVNGFSNDAQTSYTTLYFGNAGKLSVQTTVVSTTEMRGQVANDAKLDSVKIHHEAVVNISLSGDDLDPQIPNFVRIPTVRELTVNMRGGGDVDGPGYEQILLPGTLHLAQYAVPVAQVAGGIAESGFAMMLADAKATYRVRESAWNVPNTCAKLEVVPAAFPFGVSPGTTGQVTAMLSSYLGAAVANGSLTESTSVGSVKTSPGGNSSQGSWDVDWTAGDPVDVAVVDTTLKAVSRAGVASTDWHADGIGPVYAKVTVHQTERVTRAGCPDAPASATMTGYTNVVPDGYDSDTTAGPATVTGYDTVIISGPDSNPPCEVWTGNYPTQYMLYSLKMDGVTGQISWSAIDLGDYDNPLFAYDQFQAAGFTTMQNGTYSFDRDTIGVQGAQYQHYVMDVEYSGTPFH